ncbi:thiamine phosphate synthase [Ammoniphilus sp. YIM 78166]|uniref:thiamine phosphate synthase n=1 Tax=Ammoniphilus sp. YIM 78166 TaxID=1644106 RepID=UPI00107032F4|nr:thiamine phosphate synthase [Ammoniphilus sp. YIM 78166]
MNKRDRMAEWDVYLVMDLEGHGRFSALELAKEAIEGGVRVVQIREKRMGDAEFIQLASPIQQLCQEKNAVFIINDRLSLAVEMKADGLHLGQDDLPEGNVRELIGEEMILGISASSVEEALKGIEHGADYLGVGSIYPTHSKSDAGDAVTPSLITDIRRLTELPIVGIGGIQLGFAAPVIHAGGNSVAVISAVCHAESPKQAAVALKKEIQAAKQKV